VDAPSGNSQAGEDLAGDSFVTDERDSYHNGITVFRRNMVITRPQAFSRSLRFSPV